MTIIVEDGSIVAGANSYVSVATADAYFALRNNTVWASLDPVLAKPACLIKATDYMLQAYRTRWQGFRVGIVQSLDWPRFQVVSFGSPGNYGPSPYYYPPTVVPTEIQNAQCELAVRASAYVDLAPDLDRITSSEKIGSIAITYDNDFSPVITYRAVDLLLGPFFNSSGVNSRVGRS